MSPRETAPPFDAKTRKDFNNFFCYLPGGRYCEPDFVTSRKAKKTIVDLDKAATKLGIDVVAISTEMNEGHSKVWEAIRMMQDKGDSPEARKIAEEGEAIKQEAHKKLIPLFEEMLKLGYSPNELMG